MVGAAAVVPVLNLVHGIAKEARDLVKGDQDLQVDLDDALRDADCNLRFLCNDMNKEMSESSDGHGEPQKWILKLHELVYDMQDFMDDRCRDPKTSALVRIVKTATLQRDRRREHVKRVQGFMNKIKEIAEEKKASSAAAAAAAPPPPLGGTTVGASRPLGSAPPKDDPEPVGIMRQPKEEIIEQLLAAGGHEDERKVISIVGCVGVGKTTLAKALWYDPRVQGRFHPHCAWVPAPQSADKVEVQSVLKSLLQHFRRQEAADAAVDVELHQPQTLQEFLCNKRYIVIVDGVQQREVLNTILSALPKNEQGSRVVVTTSIRSVAKAFSTGGGYLHTMRGLGRADTEDLFWRTLNLKDPPPAVKEGMKTFFDKCDGLPLVVVAASKFLGFHGVALGGEDCKEVGTELGNQLAGRDQDPAFAEARSALARYWHSLPRNEQKMCMFSLSSFPKDKDDHGHGGIETKSLLRRWVAEGLVAQDNGKSVEKVACEYRDKLLDLCILEPASVSSSMRRRNNKCQVQGVTLEYLVHRSVSWNFIALVQEGRLLPRGGDAGSCSIRRVAIHGGDDGDITSAVKEADLPSVRSLTVRKTRTVPASWLERCKMLRVLDLEGCDKLGSESDNRVVRLICKLLHLRYLSLRSTMVAEIPTDIELLQSLETLDVRDTKVEKLPIQVLMLPQLAHLFGRFELPKELEAADPKGKLVDFFSSKSKLVTLAGFKISVNSKRQAYKVILCHARMLKKVKVWCELPPDADHLPAASATIPPPKPKGLLKAFRSRIICRDIDVATRPMNAYKKVDAVSSSLDGKPSILDGLVTSLNNSRLTIPSKALDSLSVDFPGGHCSHFLGCVLKETCAVRSIKVRGRMEPLLPGSQALKKMIHIKELHLCNTGLGTNKLSVLQNMDYLEYLKLTEDTTQGFGDGSFVVNAGGFPSLRHLCFHGQRLPAVRFTEGSMKALLSLQLICVVPVGRELGVTGVANLPCLDEVILHPDASTNKMEAWKAETLKHSRRPNVKLGERKH